MGKWEFLDSVVRRLHRKFYNGLGQFPFEAFPRALGASSSRERTNIQPAKRRSRYPTAFILTGLCQTAAGTSIRAAMCPQVAIPAGNRERFTKSAEVPAAQRRRGLIHRLSKLAVILPTAGHEAGGGCWRLIFQGSLTGLTSLLELGWTGPGAFVQLIRVERLRPGSCIASFGARRTLHGMKHVRLTLFKIEAMYAPRMRPPSELLITVVPRSP